MKTRLTKIGLLAAMTALALCLIGCSEEQSNEQSGPTTVTPYTLTHDDQYLWFRIGDNKNQKYSEVSKDALAYLYIFENGQLAYRSNWMTQIGKLASMSDEEIIELYKENDAEFRQKYEAGQAGIYSNYGEYISIDSPLDISVIELHTDSTGNETEKELVAMYEISSSLTIILDNGRVSPTATNDWKIWFSDPTTEAFQIYDTYYGGFKVSENSNSTPMWFVMRTDNPSDYVFALDEVGTEGTEAH